ncbi:MAG: phage capsid protein [Candidatus Bathyarchaeota archaeon]
MSQEKREEEIVIDFSPLQARLDQLTKEIAEIREKLVKHDEPKGKGIIENQEKSRLAKIVESLRAGSIREQWEAPLSIPQAPVASLINYVTVSRAMQGQMGDVVSIPYVKDVTGLTLSTGELQAIQTGNLYGVATTTLDTRGAYSDIPYSDVEKLSEDLLAEIENAFRVGIIRAVDAAIVSAVNSASGVSSLSKGSESVNFDVDWIAEAMNTTGNDIRPQDYVLVLTPNQYLALYKDVASSQALVFARPDIVRDGLVQEFMGVKILVLPKDLLPSHTSNSKKSAVMINRRAVVFAPKREMLFETQRLVKELKVRITASYSFGVAVVDPAANIVIQTPESAT